MRKFLLYMFVFVFVLAMSSQVSAQDVSTSIDPMTDKPLHVFVFTPVEGKENFFVGVRDFDDETLSVFVPNSGYYAEGEYRLEYRFDSGPPESTWVYAEASGGLLVIRDDKMMLNKLLASRRAIFKIASADNPTLSVYAAFDTSQFNVKYRNALGK